MDSFIKSPTAKISAQLADEGKITIAGVTPDDITPSQAATQINRLLDIVGRSVVTSGMIRTLTEEADQ